MPPPLMPSQQAAQQRPQSPPPRGNTSSSTAASAAVGSPYSFLRPTATNSSNNVNNKSNDTARNSTAAQHRKSSTTIGGGAVAVLAGGGGNTNADQQQQQLVVSAGAGVAGGGVSFYSTNGASPKTLKEQTRLGFDIIEKAWPYVHAVGRVPNKGSCILISLPDDHNTAKNGDPGHHGVLITTSFVLRSFEEAEDESAVFLEAPVAGTLGKWPDCEPVEVRLRPDKFYSSSIDQQTHQQPQKNSNDALGDDDEALGYTVVACNLASEAKPRLTIGKIQPLPLPIIVSKVPEVSVGDIHLFVTHNDGRALSYQVGIVKEVHQHHCVYDHTRTESILSSGGPVFSQSGDFIGLQHQCGENSFCMFIRSLVIHLFDSATLGPCRVSLWGDEDDASWELRKGTYASYHETYNRNNVNPNSGHSSNYMRLPSGATTYGGLPSSPSAKTAAVTARGGIEGSGGTGDDILSSALGGFGGSMTTKANANGGGGPLVVTDNDRAHGAIANRKSSSFSSNATFNNYQQSIYDPREAAENDAKPLWMARQKLRDVGDRGAQLVEYSEFDRFAQWEARRAKLPETFAPRTVREVWDEWHTDYQSLVLLLHAFPFNEQIVLRALKELTSHHNRLNVSSVASLGGIGIILHALDLHPFSEALMLAGVTTLARLSLTADNKSAITRCDGVSILISIMFEWPANYDIQQWATYALLNLTEDSNRATECVRSLVKAQGVEKIIHNMRMYPNGRHLQRWSAMLLVNVLRGGGGASGGGGGGGSAVPGSIESIAEAKEFNYNSFNDVCDGGDDEGAADDASANTCNRIGGEESAANNGSARKKSDASTTASASTAAAKTTTRRGCNKEAAVDPPPPFVTEAWAIVLSPVTITEDRGPRADTAVDATSTRVAPSPSSPLSPSHHQQVITIDFLPLLWRLLYLHRKDSFVMYGTCLLLRLLLCGVPPSVAAKIKAKNGSTTAAGAGARAAAAANNASGGSPTRNGRGAAAGGKVPPPPPPPLSMEAYALYAEGSPLFHIPIAFFSTPACLVMSNRMAYAPLLPAGKMLPPSHRNKNKYGDGNANDGDGGADDYDYDNASSAKFISERDLGLRLMPEVPAFVKYKPSAGVDDSNNVAVGSGTSSSAAAPLPSSPDSEPSYFTSMFDALVEALALHGLRHVQRRRSAAEEDAYHEAVRQLIVGTERSNVRVARDPNDGADVVDDADAMPSVRWGVLDARGRLVRLMLGAYDLSLNREYYRSGRSSDNAGKSRSRSITAKKDGEDGVEEVNTSASDALAVVAVVGGVGQGADSAYSPNSGVNLSNRRQSRVATGDASDRADADLLIYLCQCLVSVLLEADRQGLLRAEAVTPQMVEEMRKGIAVVGGLGDNGASANNNSASSVSNSASAAGGTDAPVLPVLTVSRGSFDEKEERKIAGPLDTANEAASDVALNLSASSIARANAPFHPPPFSAAAGKPSANANADAASSPSPSLAVDAVVIMRLPLILIEASYYHISDATLHSHVKHIIRLIGCGALLSPQAYPFLFHTTRKSLTTGEGYHEGEAADEKEGAAASAAAAIIASRNALEEEL